MMAAALFGASYTPASSAHDECSLDALILEAEHRQESLCLEMGLCRPGISENQLLEGVVKEYQIKEWADQTLRWILARTFFSSQTLSTSNLAIDTECD
jgi:hypothetical protein